MGPLEETLRLACWLAPDWEAVVQRLAPNMEMRDIIYGASAAFSDDGEPLGIAEILRLRLMPDVLTEAICFAEALDQEAEARITLCPNCREPNDPEYDCEFFGCTACGKEICESCASGGLCEACDAKQNGTVTVRFK